MHRWVVVLIIALVSCGVREAPNPTTSSNPEDGGAAARSDGWRCGSIHFSGGWYTCNMELNCTVGKLELDCKLDGGTSLCECRKDGVVQRTFLSRKICLALVFDDPANPTMSESRPSHDKRDTLLNTHCGWSL